MALVVLSVGLLTVAALQVKGLQFERTALNGMRATLLAADLVDRVRANPTGAALYDLGIGEATPTPGKTCADTGLAETTDPCTAAEMAAYDLWEWRQAMAAGSSMSVPGGAGGVQYLPGTPNVHRITIRWREDGEDIDYVIDITSS